MDTIAVEPRLATPYVSGNQAPVRHRIHACTQVRGRIPEGLRGALYRNGPNPQFDPGPNYHAFIGDGMIHGFWLGEGPGTIRESLRSARLVGWRARRRPHAVWRHGAAERPFS